MSKKIESIDLNILISNLKTKLNLSNKEINDLVKEDISIPISIFSSDLGMLESICLYLKDELNFSFKNISNYLKRDYKTIYSSYNNAKNKLSNKNISSNSKIKNA